MADISIQPKALSSKPKLNWPAKIATSLLKHFASSRSANQFDPVHTSAHLRSDIGYPHEARPRPIVSLGNIW
jgi:hypothetical protein